MGHAPIKVLVIEDDPGDTYLLQEFLAGVNSAPFELVRAERLVTALRCLAEADFDLILLDLSLPDSQGFDTFTRVQAYASDVPIVVLTGLDDEAVAMQALQGGAQDYLHKSRLDADMLRRAMRYAIERHRMLRELALQAQELVQTNAELAHSNQELDDFAHIVSHDLQEPLRGLQHYATFLLEDYTDKLDDAGREKLATLTRLTRHMATLIDALLDYSRLGRIELAYAETNLGHVVAEVLDSLAIRLQEEGVEVRIPTPLPTLCCDAVRVREIFRNLITNAMKYNDKPHKWIEIGVRQSADKVVCYVRDNGIGIQSRYYEAIFRIFKRLHGRDTYGGGTGVGLNIVKKLVERHGGEIWVKSTYGEGTTFFFTLEEKTRA